MTYRALLIIAVLIFGGSVSAQSKKDENPRRVKISPYGFVRNYFNYDSRKTYTAIGGEYSIIPYDENWNATQEMCDSMGIGRADLNAVPQARLLAVSTRLGIGLEGPDVLGAVSSGRVEFDFGGFGDNTMLFRIRLAYLQLNWQNKDNLRHELLVGQDWHPLSGSVMPEVLGMAAGAPFRPHSRTPQVRYTLMSGDIGVTAAALYQLQFMYNGPSWAGNGWNSAASTSYANTAIVPELFVGLNYKDKRIFAQMGSSCQPLRPRTFGMLDGLMVPVDEKLITFTPTLYFQYTDGLFASKFRTLYAQNTTHLNQLNGYGVTSVHNDGSWGYAPLRASVSYLNMAYGKKYKFNLFLGYMKNMGSATNLYNFGSGENPKYNIYMKGGENFTNLNDCYRISPSISYNLPHFNLGVEYEWTACSYGDCSSNGSISTNLHRVANHRICLMIRYNFSAPSL